MWDRGIRPVSPSSNSTVIRSPSSSRSRAPAGWGERGWEKGKAQTRWVEPEAEISLMQARKQAGDVKAVLGLEGGNHDWFSTPQLSQAKAQFLPKHQRGRD